MARKPEEPVFVLVVEDEANWQGLIRELLQEVASKLNHIIEIVIASSFSEALDQISSTSFDYVTLDNKLEDGKMARTLLDRVASLEQRVPVVVVSGVVDPSEVRDFFQDYRIEEFFWKDGFEPEMFRQTFARLLAHERKGNAETLTWLHLSDLHIGCKEESRDWESLKDALLEDIEKHQTPEQSGRCAGVVFHPDLILITGDIAYRAKQEEYEEAENLLKSVWEITGLGEKLGTERTFFVPGNHDVDRQVVKDDPLYSAVYGELANPKAGAKGWLGALDKWWNYQNLHKLWAKKFEQYLQFVNRCTTISTKLGYYAQPVRVSGIKLDIIGLNSALMSWRDGEDLERGLWIGKPQLDELEGSLSGDSSFRIALVHHPREALHYQDVAWERLQSISHIVLHGHMHKMRAISMGEPEREHVCLSGGSVHQDGIWCSQRYSYGRFNLKTKELDLDLRVTKPGAYPLYIRDNQTYPDAGADGHIRVILGHESSSYAGADGHIRVILRHKSSS